MRRSGAQSLFQFIPMCSLGLRSGFLSRTSEFFHHVFTELPLMEQGLSLYVPATENCNATAHEDVRHNCAISTAWQRFEDA